MTSLKENDSEIKTEAHCENTVCLLLSPHQLGDYKYEKTHSPAANTLSARSEHMSNTM